MAASPDAWRYARSMRRLLLAAVIGLATLWPAPAEAGYCVYVYPAPGVGTTICTP